jgi:AAA domain
MDRLAEPSIAEFEAATPTAERAASIRSSTLADVTEVSLSPLWPGVLWKRYVSLLAGMPGESKSTLTLDVAARITTGNYWPASKVRAPLGHVGIMNGEDGAADVIKPRLRVAGADLTRVHTFDGLVSPDGREHALSIVDHIPQIRDAVIRYKLTLLIIDPLASFEGRVDGHKNSEVRQMLTRLQRDIAEPFNMAVWCVTHFNKSATGASISRVMGSVGYTAAVRSVYGVVRDESDNSKRLLLPGKVNLAPDSEGFAYRVEDCDGHPRLVWDGERVQKRLDDAMSSGEQQSKVKQAVAVISELFEGNERVSSADLMEACQKQYIGRNSIYDAIRQLRLTRLNGGKNAGGHVYVMPPRGGAVHVDDAAWLQ